MRIGYLTGAYARASDSFIRGEVIALRELGHTVTTYSVRRASSVERITDEIRREDAATLYILEQARATLLRATFGEALRRPRRFARALQLTGRLRAPGIRGALLPVAYLIEACWLAERLREHRIEHLHDHIAEGSAAVAMLAAELCGIPFSFTVHGPGEFDRAPAIRLDVKVRQAAFVAAITDFARSQILRWSDPEDWHKVRVVRCGVAPQFIAPHDVVPEEEHRLVFVGRLDPVKGVALLIEAVIELLPKWPDLRLVLVGDGPGRRQLEDELRHRDATEHFEVRGWAGADAVRDEIVRARALVLPSFAEGLPVVLMEAMALGRPVVATAVGGVSELVDPGVNGWLIAPGSVDALTTALDAVLEAEPDVLSRMGQAAAQAVRDRHDRTREARRLAGLFAAALSPGEDP